MFIRGQLSSSLCYFASPSAVLDSGLRKIVYIDRGSGAFEPRLIAAGGESAYH
ncbi:MAG: hypothetical protein LAQ30_09495 [Acidobacteriia bacterium]|nr:hypothetical protein [Terriglobia bacterium]